MISITQAALHLGISVASVRRLCDAKRLTHYRPAGGHRRFQIDDLNEYLSSVKVCEKCNEVSFNKGGFKPAGARALIAKMRAEMEEAL
jgi:excisionase family DNA binding protein